MEEHIAMFSEALPVNPRPFLLKAASLIREKGSDYIRSDQIKAILWMILAQSYGQLSVIDLCKEWDRLSKVFNRK